MVKVRGLDSAADSPKRAAMAVYVDEFNRLINKLSAEQPATLITTIVEREDASTGGGRVSHSETLTLG
jgi:hypothetical protein